MDKRVDLFLMGKTGHGKSSVGNNIVGRKAFQVSDSTSSETFEVQSAWSRLQNNRIIKVVDGPGLFETRLDHGKAVEKMNKDMSKAILECPEGFHALVLVLKYGNRFTEEEKHTVEMLKSMFGESFIRDYCILVLTHGDVFKINNEPNRTFQDWCREQTGAFQSLLQECNYRAVLFDNRDPEKSDSQLQELLSVVDNMNSRGVRYTSDIFVKAAAAREQLIVRENAPELREKIQEKVDLLVDGLRKLVDQKKLSDKVRLIENLKQDAIELQTTIAVQDRGTGVLDSLKQYVGTLLQTIMSHEEVLRDREYKSDVDPTVAYKEILAALSETKSESNKKKSKIELAIDAIGTLIGPLGPIFHGIAALVAVTKK